MLKMKAGNATNFTQVKKVKAVQQASLAETEYKTLKDRVSKLSDHSYINVKAPYDTPSTGFMCTAGLGALAVDIPSLIAVGSMCAHYEGIDVNLIPKRMNTMFQEVIKAVGGSTSDKTNFNGGIIGYLQEVGNKNLKFYELEPEYHPLRYMSNIGQGMMLAGINYIRKCCSRFATGRKHFG